MNNEQKNKQEQITEKSNSSNKQENKGYLSIAYIIVAAMILIVGVVFAILDATVLDSGSTHPILLMLGIFIICFGALFLTYGVMYKSGFYIMLSSILVFIGLLYFGLDIFDIRPWWISLIVSFLVGALIMLLGLFLGARGMEVKGDNASPDYKNYLARREEEEKKKAEQAEKDAAEGKTEEKEELPKIKSFKD